MAFTFDEILKIENQLFEEFSKIGYPVNSLIQGWKTDSHSMVDFVIVDIKTGFPLMMIDIKYCTKKDRYVSIKKAFENLKEYYVKDKLPVKYIAALYIKETSEYELLDLTKSVIENDLEGYIAQYSIPSYEMLTIGAKEKAIKAEKDKQNNNILFFKILCWGVIPVIAIVLLILDATEVYVFSHLRLIVIGVCFVIILLPCFKEIKIGEIYIKNIFEKQDDESK